MFCRWQVVVHSDTESHVKHLQSDVYLLKILETLWGLMHSQGNNALQITGWCAVWFSRTACYQLWPLGLHSGIWFLASSFDIFSGQLLIGSHTSLLIKRLINLVLWPNWHITRRKLEFQRCTQWQFLSDDPWKCWTGLLVQDFFLPFSFLAVMHKCLSLSKCALFFVPFW